MVQLSLDRLAQRERRRQSSGSNPVLSQCQNLVLEAKKGTHVVKAEFDLLTCFCFCFFLNINIALVENTTGKQEI